MHIELVEPKPQKYYSIDFTITTGEYSFNCHGVVQMNQEDRPVREIHKYFMAFYSDGASYKDGRYWYDMDCVCVDDIRYRKITNEEKAILNKCGIL